MSKRKSDPRLSRYLLAIAGCLVAVALWGTIYPVYGGMMKTVDPITIGVIRNVIITVVVAIGLLAIEGPHAFIISRRELVLAAGVGSIGVVGFSGLTFIGEHLAGTGSNAAKLTAVYVMALMVLWEFVGLIQATSIPAIIELMLVIVTYAGLALIISGGGISGLLSLHNLSAGALVLAGTACWMWYTVLLRKFTTWSVLKFSAITLVLGTVALAVIDAIGLGVHVLPTPRLGAILAGLPVYLYLGVIAGAVPLILWNRSTRVITPVNALMFISVGTAVTVVMANHTGGYQENGMIMIVGGIAIVFAIGLYSAIQYRAILRSAPVCHLPVKANIRLDRDAFPAEGCPYGQTDCDGIPCLCALPSAPVYDEPMVKA